MNSLKTIILSVICLFLLFSSCEKSEWLTEGDYFFFENKGAVMPVWVIGNIESGVFILTNHGGPGWSSGHDYHISVGFQGLEEDYALIYWDQRMSGMSQGDPNKEDMSIDLHIEDLEMLVEIIRHKYNPKSFFLMGHSWGGVLTSGYLGRENHQEYFNGWIDVDGSIQDEFEQVEKKIYIMDRIDTTLANSDDKEFWQYIIDWYEENPNPVESDDEPYTYVAALGGYAYDWEISNILSPIPYKELVFSSPYTFAIYWTQYSDMPWMDGYDVTEDVSNITIPALLLWGKHDGTVPTPVSQFTYDLLGTPPSDKEIVLFDKCAHFPYNETPYEFQGAVTSFVEKYK